MQPRFAQLGELVVLFSFQVTAPSVFQKPFRPLTLTIIMLLPMILFAFLYLRMDKTKQVLAEESLAEAKNAPRHLRSSEHSCCSRGKLEMVGFHGGKQG